MRQLLEAPQQWCAGSNSAHACAYSRTHVSRPFALRIAAAAVAQRHGAMLGQLAPHVALFVASAQNFCARAADSDEPMPDRRRAAGCSEADAGGLGVIKRCSTVTARPAEAPRRVCDALWPHVFVWSCVSLRCEYRDLSRCNFSLESVEL